MKNCSPSRIKKLFLHLFLVMPIFAVAQGSIASLRLINSTTDTEIQVLNNGDVVDLNTTGLHLNVQALTNPSSVDEVRFDYDGSLYNTESTAPYAFAGDVSGDYNDWTPSVGTHTITATPSNPSAGAPTTVQFEIINSGGGTYDPPADPGTGAVIVSGELKKWHKVTLSFDGPEYTELSAVNPALDYRLNVTFTKGAKVFVVPGYFAADGNAGETSATSGNVWRVHFAPEEEGTWNYSTSFRIGQNIAVSDVPNEGTVVPPIDGKTGSISISSTDKTGRDHRGKGRLKYVGEHYLQFAETGEYFVKGGVDSPENMLAYDDIDNTPDVGGRRKSWTPHAGDWNVGDPSWKGNKGTEIIGAINYLSGKGLNAFSFLTMNINGDDRNVYPYVANNNFTQFDCSKLDQWEIIFEHADKMGMYLHFKTQETENDQLLDGGDLGINRKLYYRTLIARFGHHLALNWNIGEENTQTEQQQKDMAQYFYDHDPYQHHIVMHTFIPKQNLYDKLLGSKSKLTGVSTQETWHKVHESTLEWVDKSRNIGKKWVVANDEQGHANHGLPPDPGYDGFVEGTGGSPTQHEMRRQTLWGNLMAGGGGVEYYFGYNLPQTDLSCEDYRSRDRMYGYTKHATDFFENYPDLIQLKPHDELVSTTNNSAWCLADSTDEFIIFKWSTEIPEVQLINGVNYTIQWYNPRTGGALQNGSLTQVTGQATKSSIGNPPSELNDDWAAWIKSIPGGNQPPTASFTTNVTSGVAPLLVRFDASGSSDPDGTIASYEWDFDDGNNSTIEKPGNFYTNPGNYLVELIVTDNDGAKDTAYVTITVTDPANQKPTASFTADVTSGTAPLLVQFDASGSSDPDGSIVSYEWDFDDGNDATGQTTDNTFTTSGNYTVELIVTDNDGAKDTAYVTITVTDPANQKPTASFTADVTSGTAPLLVQFDASGSSDPDGSIVSYAWDFDDGNDATGQTTNNTFTTSGDYTVELIVTDNDGAKDTAYVTITVTDPANQKPTASFTADVTSGTAPLLVQFDASGSSDPDGSIVSYAWDFDDGNDATGQTTNNTFTTSGDYTVELIVTDNDGAKDTAYVTITVTDPANQKPTASFTADVTSGTAPLLVQFDASGSSDPDGSIVSYAWDFDDGNDATGQTTDNTFTTSGNYTVELIVTDNDGAKDTAYVTITVTDPANQKPTASFTADVTSGTAPLLVQFDASGSSDPDGSIVSYEWDFDDGNDATGETSSNTFTDAGNYTVELIVTDNDGAKDTAYVTITVTDPANLKPTASFTADVTSGTAPLLVQFDASGSSDPDGSVISYVWDFDDGNDATGETSSNTFTDPGNYTVELIVTDNDGATDTAYLMITVNEGGTPFNKPPVADLSADITLGAVPLLVQFDASGSNDPDGSLVSYEWNFGDGNIATGETVTNTFNNTGLYTVTLVVTDNNGATDEDSIVIECLEKPLSVEEYESEFNIRFSPNPFFSRLNIRSTKSIETISLYDVNGRVILTEGNINKDKHTLNLDFVENGIYTLKVTYKDGISFSKILKNQ